MGLWLPPSVDTMPYVSVEHQRIAELVNEYNADLWLAFIPPDKREPGDQPFAVIHRPDGGQEYIVLYADTVDERILERLYLADNDNNPNRISQMEAHNAAVAARKRKEEEDAAEERKEFTAAVLASPLSVYKHNGIEYR